VAPVGPVGPCCKTKLKTAAEVVPALFTVGVPFGPVEDTDPIDIVAAEPDGPVLPVGPAGPVSPLLPSNPLDPAGPVGPIDPEPAVTYGRSTHRLVPFPILMNPVSVSYPISEISRMGVDPSAAWAASHSAAVPLLCWIMVDILLWVCQ
jgi:hypothetical protein